MHVPVRRTIILLIVLAFLVVPCLSASDAPPGATALSQDQKGYRIDANGWVLVHIEGEPYERGYQYGYLIAPELARIKRSVIYLTPIDTGMDWDYFVNKSQDLMLP